MGIFKKNKKGKEENKSIELNKNIESDNKDNKKNDIEILDLEKTEDVMSPNEIKKENRLLIIIVIVLIIFVIFLPTITGFISKKSIFSYNKQVKEIINNKTVDGMLEIGKEEGTITIKNIRFYNVTKRSNNMISVIYLPETSIKDVNSLGIYLEFYSSNKTLINRVKFTNDEKLERKVQGTYSINVNENIYRQAKYAKLVIIKDEEFNKTENSLTCTNEFTDENYKVEYKITYNFSTNGLVSYQVKKEAKPIESLINNETEETEQETSSNKYKDSFKKEAEEIKKTNTKKLEYDEKHISYTIELSTLELGKSNYKIRHSQGSIKRQVKLTEESNKWVCK